MSLNIYAFSDIQENHASKVHVMAESYTNISPQKFISPNPTETQSLPGEQ